MMRFIYLKIISNNLSEAAGLAVLDGLDAGFDIEDICLFLLEQYLSILQSTVLLDFNFIFSIW